MALPNQELFLDRFIAFNKERYSSDPAVLEILNHLSLNAVVFFNPRKETLPTGEIKHTTDLEVPGVLLANDQSYLPANFPDHGVADLVTTDPIVEGDLPAIPTVGIYWTVDAEGEPKRGAVLVAKGSKNKEAIIDLVVSKCRFVLERDEVSVDDNLVSVTIDSPTIVGTLVVVESMVDLNVNHYDGVHKHDGSIKY